MSEKHYDQEIEKDIESMAKAVEAIDPGPMELEQFFGSRIWKAIEEAARREIGVSMVMATDYVHSRTNECRASFSGRAGGLRWLIYFRKRFELKETTDGRHE